MSGCVICDCLRTVCVWVCVSGVRLGGHEREREREREKGHTSWLLTLLREFGPFDSNDPGRASDSVKSV